MRVGKVVEMAREGCLKSGFPVLEVNIFPFRFPDFCMSSIREDHMDLRAATLCAAETGHVYVIGRCWRQEQSRVMEGGIISSVVQGAGGPDAPLAHS